MKNLIILCSIIVLQFPCHAQFSSFNLPRHNYPEGIKKVTEYRYNYNNEYFQCDSTPRRVKEFNQKGQLIKETFKSQRRGKGVTNPYYKYKYNDLGFLIDIDSFGMFGYSWSSSETELPLSFENQTTLEKFMIVDSVRKLVEKVFYQEGDSAKYKAVYTYNKIYQLEKEDRYVAVMSENFERRSTISYFYDDRKMLIKKIYRDERDEIYVIEEIAYEYY